MKVFFTAYLALNFLLEMVAAITLIGGTLGLISIAQLEASMWSMNYGFAAIAIASAIFWVWPYRSIHAVVGSVLGILLTFHALVSVSFAIQGDQVSPIVVHGVMAVLAVFFYSRRTKWCSD